MRVSGRAIAGVTLRRLGQIEALIRGFVPKAPPPHKAGPTLDILYMGTAELLFLNVAAHAAVDGANRLAQDDPKAVHFKPLINAVLRRISREGNEIAAAQDAPRLNTPDWLWTRWSAAYGEETTRAIATAHLQRPPVDLVFKERGTAPDGEPLFGNVVRLREPAPVEGLPGFAEGEWWVQDAATSLPARLLGDVRGANRDRPLRRARRQDHAACRGRRERDRGRARSAPPRAAARKSGAHQARCHIDRRRRARFHAPDARAPFVLLDAPCTATGTIRRHPELPWIKSASDVTLCEQAAGELLDHAATLVAPGGLLVFAVCSLEPEEGVEQAEAFLRRSPEFARVPVTAEELFGHAEWINEQGDLRTLPSHLSDKGGMDGFYAPAVQARLIACQAHRPRRDRSCRYRR